MIWSDQMAMVIQETFWFERPWIFPEISVMVNFPHVAPKLELITHDKNSPSNPETHRQDSNIDTDPLISYLDLPRIASFVSVEFLILENNIRYFFHKKLPFCV